MFGSGSGSPASLNHFDSLATHDSTDITLIDGTYQPRKEQARKMRVRKSTKRSMPKTEHLDEEEDQEAQRLRNRLASQKHRMKRRVEDEHKAARLKGLEERNMALRASTDAIQRQIKELVSSILKQRLASSEC
jgi:hypothetical protein